MKIPQEIQDLMPERKEKYPVEKHEYCLPHEWCGDCDDNKKKEGFNHALQEVEAVLPQMLALAEKRGAEARDAEWVEKVDKLTKEVNYLTETPRVRRDFCEWCGAACLKGQICDCHTEKVRQQTLEIIKEDLQTLTQPPHVK